MLHHPKNFLIHYTMIYHVPMYTFQKYFYHEHPKAKTMDFGDLTERLNLKKSLNCKPFEWFLREVYPELIPQIKHEEL